MHTGTPLGHLHSEYQLIRRSDLFTLKLDLIASSFLFATDHRYRPDPKQRRHRPVFRDLVQEEENSGHIHASSGEPSREGGLDQGPGADPVGAGSSQPRLKPDSKWG